jgi:hypothetical protein
MKQIKIDRISVKIAFCSKSRSITVTKQNSTTVRHKKWRLDLDKEKRLLPIYIDVRATTILLYFIKDRHDAEVYMLLIFVCRKKSNMYIIQMYIIARSE